MDERAKVGGGENLRYTVPTVGTVTLIGSDHPFNSRASDETVCREISKGCHKLPDGGIFSMGYSRGKKPQRRAPISDERF
jgi:hypothetical protein